jgi:hypothetical protein
MSYLGDEDQDVDGSIANTTHNLHPPPSTDDATPSIPATPVPVQVMSTQYIPAAPPIEFSQPQFSLADDINMSSNAGDMFVDDFWTNYNLPPVDETIAVPFMSDSDFNYLMGTIQTPAGPSPDGYTPDRSTSIASEAPLRILPSIPSEAPLMVPPAPSGALHHANITAVNNDPPTNGTDYQLHLENGAPPVIDKDLATDTWTSKKVKAGNKKKLKQVAQPLVDSAAVNAKQPKARGKAKGTTKLAAKANVKPKPSTASKPATGMKRTAMEAGMDIGNEGPAGRPRRDIVAPVHYGQE